MDELFSLMHLFAGCAATDLTSEETAAAAAFRRTTIVLYLNGLDGGATWTTLIRYVPSPDIQRKSTTAWTFSHFVWEISRDIYIQK